MLFPKYGDYNALFLFPTTGVVSGFDSYNIPHMGKNVPHTGNKIPHMGNKIGYNPRYC
jgi:hypothetical protein